MLVDDWAVVIGGSGGSAAGAGEDVAARGAAGGVVLEVVVLDAPGEALPLEDGLPGSGGVIWNSELVPCPAEIVWPKSPVGVRTDAERTMIPALAIEARARMVRIRVWPG